MENSTKKAYILLGDEEYLDRFNIHYNSIKRYIKSGPMLVDVQMHKPTEQSRGFMDALSAFWPGVQVLKEIMVLTLFLQKLFSRLSLNFFRR